MVGSTSLLSVIKYNNDFIRQTITDYHGFQIWTRSKWQTLAWEDWQRIDNYGTSSLSELASALGVYYKAGAVVPARDANTLTVFGAYQTAPESEGSTNVPANFAGGFIIAFPTGGGACLQLCMSCVSANVNNLYYRRLWGSWSIWKAFTTT